MEYQSYQNIFTEKLKKCESKKDYKKLCKEMIFQFGVIDQVEENQWKIFSSMIGPEAYLEAQALAIKMYILKQQGVDCSVISISDELSGLEDM